jgi:hypothetical protein
MKNSDSTFIRSAVHLMLFTNTAFMGVNCTACDARKGLIKDVTVEFNRSYYLFMIHVHELKLMTKF